MVLILYDCYKVAQNIVFGVSQGTTLLHVPHQVYIEPAFSQALMVAWSLTRSDII
jgi:hypothetical protein